MISDTDKWNHRYDRACRSLSGQSGDTEKNVEKLLESARHLVSMVNDILDMNKLETEQFVENDIPFNLAAVLNRVNTDQQMQAGKKD